MVLKDPAAYEETCNKVHEYILSVTEDFKPEKIQDTRLARKKVSVFTYGVCVALADQCSIDKDELYYRYLLKGGLKTHQARVVVERTSLEFIKKDYATVCFDAGYQLVVKNKVARNINSQYFSELLTAK